MIKLDPTQMATTSKRRKTPKMCSYEVRPFGAMSSPMTLCLFCFFCGKRAKHQREGWTGPADPTYRQGVFKTDESATYKDCSFPFSNSVVNNKVTSNSDNQFFFFQTRGRVHRKRYHSSVNAVDCTLSCCLILGSPFYRYESVAATRFVACIASSI